MDDDLLVQLSRGLIPYRMKLQSLLPDYYARDGYVKVRYEAIGRELEDALATINMMVVNLSPLYCDGWGVAFWERVLGFPQNPQLPIEVRKAWIRERIVGYGSFNMDNLQSLFADFGVSGLIVIPDPPNLSLTLEYPSTQPFADEALKAFQRFVPAHIEGIVLPHTNRTWGDLNNSGLTWGNLNQSYTWGALNT